MGYLMFRLQPPAHRPTPVALLITHHQSLMRVNRLGTLVLRLDHQAIPQVVNNFHSREIVLRCPVPGVLVGEWQKRNRPTLIAEGKRVWT